MPLQRSRWQLVASHLSCARDREQSVAAGCLPSDMHTRQRSRWQLVACHLTCTRDTGRLPSDTRDSAVRGCWSPAILHAYETERHEYETERSLWQLVACHLTCIPDRAYSVAASHLPSDMHTRQRSRLQLVACYLTCIRDNAQSEQFESLGYHALDN